VTETRTTRRDFCRRTALLSAAPYVITSTALGQGEKEPASERVTFGVVGLGDRGPTHLGMGGGAAQLVGVSDTWTDRRERVAAQRKVPGYTDFRELIGRDDVDAVVLAVPDHWHVPMAIRAAKAGKDTYCEKALGISVEQNQKLREAVKRYGTVFQYGPQRRSGGNWRHACELVRNGRIGEVREVHVTAATFGPCAPKDPKPTPPPETLAYDLWLGPAPEEPYVPGRCRARGWYCIYDYCLGWISAWGSHVLSIAQWGFDTHKAGVTEYEGSGELPTNLGLNDNLVRWDVRMTCAGGVKMSLTTGTNTVKFVGSEGTVWVSDRGQGAEPESLWGSQIGPDEIHLKSGSLHTDFVECVKSRATTVSPIDDAVYSDIISHLADIAIRTGRKIKWDPAKEQILGDAEAARMLSRPMRGPWEV